MPVRPVMSLQFKTLIVQLIKTLTELLGEGGIQWTGKEICLRNPTNLLADQTTGQLTVWEASLHLDPFWKI